MPRPFKLPLVLALATAPLLVAADAEAEARDKGFHLSPTPAVIFLILYGVLCLITWLQYFRNKHRPRAYMLNLTIGLFCMTIGFVLRARDSYAWQFLPCAFLAADYTILKHLARALPPAVSQSTLFLPARAIVWIFLLSDVVTFCAQTAGTVFVIMGGKWLSMGEKIAISGLVLQLLSFSLFAILLWVFARRMSSRHPDLYHPPSSTPTWRKWWSTRPTPNVRALVRVLGVSCVGIFIRSTFRLVEQCTGFFGPVARDEVFFYLFDSTPLFLGMAGFALVWPTKVVEGVHADTGAESVGMGLGAEAGMGMHGRGGGREGWSEMRAGGGGWDQRQGAGGVGAKGGARGQREQGRW
ncbi:hypothetical protein JCM10207_001705 [Rhodosporidiobolus poonsookiae]